MRYKEDPYDPTGGNAGTIAQMLLRSGQVQSQKLRDLAEISAREQSQQGQISGNLVNTLGRTVNDAVGNFVDLRANEQKNKIAEQELAQRKEVNAANIAASEAQTARAKFDQTQAEKTVENEAALKEKNRIAMKIADGLRDPDPQKREVVLGVIQDPELREIARKILLARDKQNADYRATRAQSAARAGYTDDWTRIVVALDPMPNALEHYDAQMKKLAEAGIDPYAARKQYVDSFWKDPEDPKYSAVPANTAGILNSATGKVEPSGLPSTPKAPTLSEPKEYLVNGQSMLLRPGSNGQMFTLDNQPLPAGTKIQAKPEKVAGEGAHMWVLRDGKTIRIPESQYRQGDLPSNARTDLRPVTAGDAEELAAFDSALDDIDVLRKATTKEGATGIMATLGTKTPPWVTSITGWGTDAKARNALIALVKQTIGKTLEGGVLRKEDEIKYKDILPTIQDDEAVVTSKLAGLEAKMRKSKGRRLDALDDANYDVGKFRARETKTARDTTDDADTVYYDSNGKRIAKP